MFSPVSMQWPHNPSHVRYIIIPEESHQDHEKQVLTLLGVLGTPIICVSGATVTTFVIGNSLILVNLALLLFIWLQKPGNFSVLFFVLFLALGAWCVLSKYLLNKWQYSWYKSSLLSMCKYSFSSFANFHKEDLPKLQLWLLKKWLHIFCLHVFKKIWCLGIQMLLVFCFVLFCSYFSLCMTTIILLFPRLVIPEPTAGTSRQ